MVAESEPIVSLRSSRQSTRRPSVAMPSVTTPAAATVQRSTGPATPTRIAGSPRDDCDEEGTLERSVGRDSGGATRRSVEHERLDDTAGEVADPDRDYADPRQERRRHDEPDDAERRRCPRDDAGLPDGGEVARGRDGDRPEDDRREADERQDVRGVAPGVAEDDRNQRGRGRCEHRKDQRRDDRGTPHRAENDRRRILSPSEHVRHRREADGVERVEGKRRQREDPVGERPDAERRDAAE